MLKTLRTQFQQIQPCLTLSALCDPGGGRRKTSLISPSVNAVQSVLRHTGRPGRCILALSYTMLWQATAGTGTTFTILISNNVGPFVCGLPAPVFVPSPTSPHLISCEFQHTVFFTTSTLRNPSTQRVFPHIYLYRKLQPYTVLTLFSLVILMHTYLCFHPSNPQLVEAFEGEKRSAEPLFVYLYVTWHLTSWQRSS